MKTETRTCTQEYLVYITNDGKEFDNQKAAEKHEKMVGREEIGQYISSYLKDKGLSVRAFADQIQASKSAVYGWINGTNKPLDIYYKKLLELLEPYFNK